MSGELAAAPTGRTTEIWRPAAGPGGSAALLGMRSSRGAAAPGSAAMAGAGGAGGARGDALPGATTPDRLRLWLPRPDFYDRGSSSLARVA